MFNWYICSIIGCWKHAKFSRCFNILCLHAYFIYIMLGCINRTPGCVLGMRVGLLVSVSLCLEKKKTTTR